MNKQKEILVSIARKHGLNISQAEEIFNLLGEKISKIISDADKKSEDNLYDKEKFHVIHIDNFGKFIPNQRKIRHANYCLKIKNIKQNEHNI
jgi:hypothetical protein